MASLEQQYRSTMQDVDSALVTLLKNQNALLDAVDKYQERIGARTRSERHVVLELIRTINIIATLPHLLANQVYEWKLGMLTTISAVGFKATVLDELLINLRLMDVFLKRENVHVEEFNIDQIERVFKIIYSANELFGRLAGEEI